MDISAIMNNRDKKLSLLGFFEDSDYVTIKYIDRDIWLYINQLTGKTVDGVIYSRAKHYPDSIGITEKWNQAISELPVSEIETAKECTKIVNKLIIDHGLSSTDHSLTSSGQKISLSYDIVNKIGGLTHKETGLDLMTHIITEIRNYNNEFNLGELKLGK